MSGWLGYTEKLSNVEETWKSSALLYQSGESSDKNAAYFISSPVSSHWCWNSVNVRSFCYYFCRFSSVKKKSGCTVTLQTPLVWKGTCKDLLCHWLKHPQISLSPSKNISTVKPFSLVTAAEWKCSVLWH